MLGEYKVSRSTRRCHTLDRPLREGEWYYSVVIESGDEFARQDYSAEAWSGPPDESVGWWKCRMPTSGEKKLVPAPNEVLIELLRQKGDGPDRAKSRYLLALMLLRRKLVRLGPRSDEPDTLIVEVVSDNSRIEMPVCEITASESETLREELNELLYCEAESEDTEAELGEE